MKTLFVVCLVTTLGLSMAKSAQQEGNPEAAKIAREGAQAAKDQDWNKAIERFHKAAEIDRKFTPNLAIAYQQRALSYAGDQRFQDALNDLNESIKINPRDARAYEQRAAIEMKINDYDKALADYGEALKTNPKNKEAVERKQRLQKIQSQTAPPPANATPVAAPPKKKP